MQKNIAFAKGIYHSFFKHIPRINFLFIMRLSVCCGVMLIASFNLFASVNASGQSINEIKVTMQVQHESLSTALQKLQDQSSLSIFYPSAKVMVFKNINIGNVKRSVAETLDLLLKGTGLDYKQDGNKIIISEKKPLAKPVAGEQFKRITGMVVDENGQPLPGITVRLKLDKGNSTATDENGHFHLEVNNPNDILIFSFIGYDTREIPVSNYVEGIKIVLKESVGSLNEVQVIGYGTTTRRISTGSISSITSKELSKQTVDNPLAALQGRIAGVQITQDNGLPGAGLRINIRGAYNGVSTAGFLPLYVIDGVPFTLFNGGSPASDNLNAYGVSGANGGVSPFSMISPDDIERIDVLKDADATAIYGSRGSNGVILITTKRGSKGKTVVNVNVNHGIAEVAHYIPMMDTQEYLAMRKAAFAYSGVTPTTANAKDLTVWDQNADTDWQKWLIGQTSHTTNATASVSGGDAQNDFLFSSSYRKQGTVYRGDYGANNFSGRLNAGHRSSNGKFSINASVNYSYMGTDMPTNDFVSLYNLAPNYPLYNADGSVNWTSTSPLSYLLQNTKAQTTNLITNLNVAYKILPGLTVKANLGYTLTRLKQQQTRPASSQNPAGTTSSTLRYADNDNGNYIAEPQAEYNRNLGKGKLDVLVGTTFQQSKATGVSLTGTGYSNEALINSLLAAGSVTTSYNNNSIYKYTALFSRLNYNWEDKYIFDGTFRRDGSSRFGENHRFGNFGALGASWIFTQESFMKDLTFLSFGKLRSSYGITGNDQIPDYQYYALNAVAGSAYSYGGTAVTYPSLIANPNLQWETTKKLDIALELGFFKDRILLKTDYYRNRSSNLLTYITTPAQTGVTSYLGNLNANVQNKGWEFELNTKNLESKNFSWSTSINLTINQNKLLQFDGLATSSYANTFVIGQPTDIQKLYHYTGTNATTGLPTFQDVDGDGVLTAAKDTKIAPRGTPYYAGISNTITYQSFSLDFTFQYNHRYSYLNSTLGSSPYGSTYTNQSSAILGRWMQPGDTAFYPAAGITSNSLYSTLSQSDYNWGDASYLKLKTVSLNYTVPKNWANRLKMSNASIYLQGQNLYTWAKQKYTFDPETTAPGTGPALGTGRYLALPQLRTIVLGLNCSF